MNSGAEQTLAADLDALEAALLAERAALEANDVLAIEVALDRMGLAVAALSKRGLETDDRLRERIGKLKALASDVEVRANVAFAMAARRLAALTAPGGIGTGAYSADGRLAEPRQGSILGTA